MINLPNIAACAYKDVHVYIAECAYKGLHVCLCDLRAALLICAAITEANKLCLQDVFHQKWKFLVPLSLRSNLCEAESKNWEK